MGGMLRDLEERVRTLIAAIKAIEGESERVYLTMGRLFPILMAETERSYRSAEESLTAFGVARRVTAGEGRSRDEMGAFATEAGAWFKTLHDRDAAFLERINDSIERLSALDGLISGVRLDSEEMEIISLNAMTVALKSGSAGKAFSVITDELKRLSSQTILLTETITGRGRSLLELFGRLRDSLGELDSFQDEFFSGLEIALSAAFSGLRSELVGATEFFSGLIGQAKELRGPVQSIMQEVQLQDIVRQSLDHVTIALREAEGTVGEKRDERPGEAEEIAFIGAIAELSASLLDDIIGKVDTSAATFERHIDEVERRTARIEELRAEFDSARERKRAEAGTVAEGNTPVFGFVAGDRIGRDFAAASSRYLNLKKSVFATARRLADQVKVLDESFKGLAALLARFKNIVVASRIEIAKNKSLGSVSTTVQGMVTLTGRIESDVSGAMNTTKGFIKVSMTAIDEYARGGDGEGRRTIHDIVAGEAKAVAPAQAGISATLEILSGDIESLSALYEATGSAIGGFVLFTPEFLARIREARRELSSLQGLAERLRGARGELASLDEEAANSLDGGVDREIHSERLKEMIQRFTILTHKRTAADLAHFEIESGAETGDVTIF